MGQYSKWVFASDPVFEIPQLSAETCHGVSNRCGKIGNIRRGSDPLQSQHGPAHVSIPSLHGNYGELARLALHVGYVQYSRLGNGHPRQLANGKSMYVGNREGSHIALPTPLDDRTIDFETAQWVGPVQDDDLDPVFESRFKSEFHAANECVRPSAYVL